MSTLFNSKVRQNRMSLKSALYGISPVDPIALAASGLLLMAVVLAACYLPARRATRIDPMAALRHE
jgi:ABC-type antimicrobial peptide transport system permease subunit